MKVALYAMVVIGALFYIITAYSLSMENEFFSQSVQNQDALGAIQSLARQTPNIEGRVFEGDAQAPITLIYVEDFLHTDFDADTLQAIKSRYVDTGQARLYFKYIITEEEYQSGTGRMLAAKAALCYNEFSYDKTIMFHESLHMKDPVSIASEFGLETEQFRACMEAKNPLLYYDVLETEDFSIVSPSMVIGIDGLQNDNVYGALDLERLEKRIRLKQVKVGI